MYRAVRTECASQDPADLGVGILLAGPDLTGLLYSTLQLHFPSAAIQRLLGGPLGLANATPGSPASLSVPT